MPCVSSMVCLASAILCTQNIPVVQGFTPSSGDQSQLRNLRQSSDLFFRSHPDSITPVPVGQKTQQKLHKQSTAKNLQHHQQQAKEPEHHLSNTFHTWWTASKSRRALAAAQQQESKHVVMDNYLESIDRRYKRLHSHDRKKGRKDSETVSNVAWSFITQTEPNSAVEEQRKQEDAIYVLGLADLASRELLEKHHLPIPKSMWKDHDNSIVIEAQSSVIEKEYVSAVSPKTNSSTSQSTVNASKLMASALFCIQVVKNVQNAYAHPLSLVPSKTKAAILHSVKVGRNAFGATVAAAANMISMNGGGMSKYAVHFVSIFAMALMTTTLLALRPLTKA